MNISELSLRRPILAFVMNILIVLFGVIGFKFLGNMITPDTPELPVHNRKLALALLEIELT